MFMLHWIDRPFLDPKLVHLSAGTPKTAKIDDTASPKALVAPQTDRGNILLGNFLHNLVVWLWKYLVASRSGSVSQADDARSQFRS
jgi:hypothetical protein